jgi:hypothetical protein
MSGPIVRKYGFPNFEKIFGKRPLQHGLEEPPAGAEAPSPGARPAQPQAEKPGEAKPSDPATDRP